MKIIEHIVEGLLHEDDPKVRFSVRPHEHRGIQGFLISGSGGGAFGTKVFAKTREGAEKIKAALLRGDHEEVDKILLAGG